MAKSSKQSKGRSSRTQRDPENVEFDTDGHAYDAPTSSTSTVAASGRRLGGVIGSLGNKKKI